MNTLRFILTMIVIACPMISASSAETKSSRVQRSKTVVPDVPEVFLGMTLRDFLSVRKNVRKASSIFRWKKESPNRVDLADMRDGELTEKINGKFFTFAVYSFKKGVLHRVDVNGHFTSGPRNLQSFLGYLSTIYGRPTLVGLSRIKYLPTDQRSVTVWWGKGNATAVTVFDWRLGKKDWSGLITHVVVAEQTQDFEKRLSPFKMPNAQEKQQVIAPLIAMLRQLGEGKTPQIHPATKTAKQDAVSKASLPADFAPTWMGEDVLLYSTRLLEGEKELPEPKNLDERIAQIDWPRLRLATLNSKGSMTGFFRSNELRYSPTWASKTHRIAFGNLVQVWVLDLDSQEIGVVNTRRVYRSMPTWDTTGTLLAMVGTHSPSNQTDRSYQYDEDIFVSRISDKLSGASTDWNICVARVPGREILPIWSPDDQWIYFAHQNPQPQLPEELAVNDPQALRMRVQKNWSIYRAHFDVASTSFSSPQKVADGLQEPDRLSWFPGQKRLLVSFLFNGVMIDKEVLNFPPSAIDIETGESSSVAIPNPFIIKSNSVFVKGATLSADGKRILFHTLEVSKGIVSNPEVAIYELDGSSLQVISPAGTILLQSFDYKKNGVLAIDAWDKLMKKPNVGVLFPVVVKK